MVGVTDETGAYRFPSLLPGTYSVRLELSGFQTSVRDGVIVSVGQTTPLDLPLKIGGLTESVTVTGESPVIDTKSANVGVNLDSKFLETTPGGRDIWSVVEYKVPGLVMATPDVGGNQGGLQRSISARGTGNGQNTQMLNGVNVGDPAAIGFAGYYYDPSSFQDIQVSSGAQDITVPSGGVFINMVTKSGTNRFGSQTLFTYQAEGTQSDNIDADLQRGPAAQRRGSRHDHELQPQRRRSAHQEPAFYFAALNDQRTHVNVVGFPADPLLGRRHHREDRYHVHLRAADTPDGYRAPFDATISRQVYDKPNRGATNTNTPESTWHEHDVLAVYQGLWNWVLSSNSFIDTRVSYNSIDFPLQLKTTQQTLADITFNPNIRTRANTTHQVMIRERMQASLNFQYFIPELIGGRHEIRAGLDNAYTPENVELLRNGDVQPHVSQPAERHHASRRRAGDSVEHAAATARAVMNTAVYLQDRVRGARSPAACGGSASRGGCRRRRVRPAAGSPRGCRCQSPSSASRHTYIVTPHFDEDSPSPLWHHFGPRLSAIYDLKGNGKTALKFSAARYYDQIGTGTPGGINPNGNVTQTFTWNDANGDLIFQSGEQTGTPTTSIPGFATLQQIGRTSLEIERPYRNEYTLGVDHELVPNLRLSVAWIQRQEHDNLTNIEIGIPFDYYDPVQRPDSDATASPEPVTTASSRSTT